MKMLSDETAKPYFLRAVYEWCIDHKHAPYLLTKACDNMPEGLAKNGRIVFNISPEAVCRLLIADKSGVIYGAFFRSGTRYFTCHGDILAIYENDSGWGFSFPKAREKHPHWPPQNLKNPFYNCCKNALPIMPHLLDGGKL